MVFFCRHLKRGKELEEEAAKPMPHVDYSLKQGQKISLNIGGKLGLHGDEEEEGKGKAAVSRPISSPVGESSLIHTLQLF